MRRCVRRRADFGQTGPMADSSRLDAARKQADNSEAWFRSPLVVAAGLILFLGAIVLVVLGLSGPDDNVAEPVDAEPEPAPVVQIEPIVFGGEGVPEVDDVVFAGDPLPEFVPGEDDAAVGTLMPDITATSLANGNAITLSTGRARVIGLLAHWCPLCQTELPELTQWLVDNRLPPNTEFVAVSTAANEEADNYPPSRWFTDTGFRSPVVVDDANATLLSSLGFSGFPAFVAVDASGVIVARSGGNVGSEGLAALFANFAS